jgi:hypothetical protein
LGARKRNDVTRRRIGPRIACGMFLGMNTDAKLARARELLDALPAVPGALLRAEQAAAGAKVRYHAAREARREAIIHHADERSAESMAVLEKAENALADAEAAHRSATATRNTVRTVHGGFLAAHVGPMIPTVDDALHGLVDRLEAIAARLTTLHDLARKHDAPAPRLVTAGPTIAALARQIRAVMP